MVYLTVRMIMQRLAEEAKSRDALTQTLIGLAKTSADGLQASAVASNERTKTLEAVGKIVDANTVEMREWRDIFRKSLLGARRS